MQKHIIISLNPKAGRRSPMKKAEELRERLQQKGFAVELLTDLDEVSEKADARHQAGELRALVGVGGDGTAATLVNRTLPGTPITLLAAGTANLLSKHYRLSANPKRLAEIIENSGSVKTFDAGRAVFNGTERLFLVMVSCGFDADVVSRVHKLREERFQQGHSKGAHISYFSYIKPIFNSLAGYSFPSIKVETLDAAGNVIPNGTAEIDYRWAFIFNINRYGWGLPLAPFAKENDGKLDAVLFTGKTLFHGFLYTALAQCFSMHRYLKSAKLEQSVKFRLTPRDCNAEIMFQLDGDYGGILPLEIEVVPNRFSFLY